MSIRRRLAKSFKYALRGLQFTWKHELNFRIEAGAAAFAVLAGLFLSISRLEWLVLLLVISAVLVLELINTSIEILVDLVKPRLHEYVELVKDVTAGAVLLASAMAALVGLLIFLPRLF